MDGIQSGIPFINTKHGTSGLAVTWHLWACLEAGAVLKAAERQSVVLHIVRERGEVFWPLLPKGNGKHMQHIVMDF